MSYAISYRLAPPREPNAALSFLGKYFRMPSAWRWLSRLWERKLLTIRGYEQSLSNLKPEEVMAELPKWEDSYKMIETYHDWFSQELSKGRIRGGNAENFLEVVAEAKSATASVITSLMMASRKRSATRGSNSELISALAEMGNANLLEANAA